MPTRNESPNVELLVDRLTKALGTSGDWELLFVDDSDDDT
ncbi:MAG: dolichol-phosphate mannosyltransferase, partial [Actinomycetota bacterium]|nr:dolichol-phosphate mannosyltransferase [Actinomycetota bacterium]